MSKAMEELGRRAVACGKKFRWLPGQPFIVGGQSGPSVARGFLDQGIVVDSMIDIATGEQCSVWFALSNVNAPADLSGRFANLWFVPLFREGAGVGCLLALVREAYGGEPVSVDCYAGHWEAQQPGAFWVASGGSEAEALVAALEAAP